ncbi:MAG: hypothetical protein NC095_04480 [Muribaculum sp.]|nr:hypothetical protein [Muribaculum sp.]
MKNLPQIINLKKGVSPLEVFGVPDVRAARQAFNHLREQFDFTFWAARNYFIRDINDPDKIVTLILPQKLIAMMNVIQTRYYHKLLGRYVITKEYGKIGLTTCIQAYTFWLQTHSSFKGNANIFGPSMSNLRHLKDNLCRNIGSVSTSSANRVRFSMSPYSAMGCSDYYSSISPYVKHNNYPCSVMFNSFRNPDAPRGIDLNYALFTDMSKWNDPDRKKSFKAQAVCLGSVLLDHRTLVIYEGNRPADFPKNRIDLQSYYDEKVLNATHRVPFLLAEALFCSLHYSKSHVIHIKI